MSFAWSHTRYVAWRGIVFNFEWQTDARYFIAHMPDARFITCNIAYDDYGYEHIIRIPASSTLCYDPIHRDRQKRIRKWVKNHEIDDG